MTHSPMKHAISPKHTGFTLVELITVMVVVGILSVAVLPRFFDVNIFRERGTADQVKAALRFGQKVAIAQHRSVDVNLTAAASADCGTTLVASAVNCTILDSVSVIPALPQTVTFNALGQRTSAAGAFTVGPTTIAIEAETGYVH